MKKVNNICFISLSALAIIMCSFAVLKNVHTGTEPVKADTTTYTVTKADVSKFKTILNSSSTTVMTIDEDNQTVTTNGGWDCGFASTAQFDSVTSSYYLKAHCYNASQGDSSDGTVGFNIYYDNTNNINFYLHWMSGNWSGSIAETVFLAHVNGQASNAYESAILPNGAFQLRSTFTDCWTDYGGWTTGNDRDSGTSINMRTEGSVIMLNKGYDMTLYVDRTTYKDRLVDVLQIQIDAFAGDGTTKQTFYTPKYAVDAFTCPRGVESKFAYIKPEIGFWNYNVGNVTYSNIEFGSNKENVSSVAKFNVYGAEPDEAEVDNETGVITYSNNNFNSGFFMADNMSLTTPRADFEAYVAGSRGDVDDTSIGYVFYYDDLNYVTMYLRWNGSAGTIDGFHVLVTLNGQTTNVYQGARKPWDDPNVTSGASGFTTIDEFKDMWSDNDGFITDTEYPCGIDNNFNKFRSESKITLASGFNMGVIRRRTVFLSKTIDEYQMFVTATGTDSKQHTWYTPSWCIDAFTYPNGGATASEFIDKVPMLGFYGYKTNEVKLSNLKLNKSTIIPRDVSKLVFGSHEESGWTLAGSDYGHNWTLASNSLTESWEELPNDEHFGEVNALFENIESNSYSCGKLSLSRLFSTSSYMGIYPYYVDENNFLLAYIQKNENSTRFVVTGKLNGEYLGGVEHALDAEISLDLDNQVLLEVGIIENTVNFYINQTPKPTYSVSFDRQSFKDRTLTNAKTGFSFYNANGCVEDFKISQSERINPYTPSEDEGPTIYQYGTRETSGFVGYTFTLPTFVAFNYLNESIDTQIVISKEDGTAIKTLDKDVFEFTVDEIGTYVVTVTAVDEWGHSAEQISYKVNFVNYSGPGESTSKQILWQTVVVLSVFGGILLFTAACAVILIRKNKKEALRAAELNKKNHEKNAQDEEE